MWNLDSHSQPNDCLQRCVVSQLSGYTGANVTCRFGVLGSQLWIDTHALHALWLLSCDISSHKHRGNDCQAPRPIRLKNNNIVRKCTRFFCDPIVIGECYLFRYSWLENDMPKTQVNTWASPKHSLQWWPDSLPSLGCPWWIVPYLQKAQIAHRVKTNSQGQ